MDETVWSAYLERIAVPRPLTADTVTLHVLHRAHQLTVPFENLSMHLDEPISLAALDLIDKIVYRARGGICYELNGAFALLLQSFDCQVSRVAARVYGDGQLGVPLDHMALIVRTTDGAGPWLVDVGFGSNSVYPLLFDSRHDQDDPSGQFLLVDTDDGDVDVLRDGKPQYRIERRVRSQSDFGPTCWWQQSSPESHFTHSTICSRLTETGRITLSGDTLITTADGTRHEERLPTDEAILAAYRGHFGVNLDRVPQVLFAGPLPSQGPSAQAVSPPAAASPQAGSPAQPAPPGESSALASAAPAAQPAAPAAQPTTPSAPPAPAAPSAPPSPPSQLAPSAQTAAGLPARPARSLRQAGHGPAPLPRRVPAPPAPQFRGFQPGYTQAPCVPDGAGQGSQTA
ncbi:MAG TPA: arylamine N-acetyltransferase [Streptosporangiaceae bacterium]